MTANGMRAASASRAKARDGRERSRRSAMDARSRRRAIGARKLRRGKSLKDKQVLLRKTQDAETGKPLRTSRWSAPSSSNSSQKGVPAAGRFAPLLQAHPWMRICLLPGLIMVGGCRFEPRGCVLQLNRMEGVAGRSAESSWRSSGRAQQLQVQELARIGRICE
jgi:hypothetical protein